jgi:hypothetical protein
MDNLPKIITNELQAPNIGTNKVFININGKTSKLETNQNAKLQYNLNNPFKLEVGDKVTLYQAFVNEGGLNTDTLTFQEDIETTIKFLYYVPNQTFKNQDAQLADGKTTSGAVAQQISPPNHALVFSDYQDFANFPNPVFLARDPAHVDAPLNNGLNSYKKIFSDLPISVSNIIGGDNGTPCYLFENHTPLSDTPQRSTLGTKKPADVVSSNAYIKPAYGEITLKIPAGNYEASSLAKNLTQQFNGAFIQDANNSNFLNDRLYNPDSSNYAGINTENPFGDQEGKATTRVFFTGINGDYYDPTNQYNLKDINEVPLGGDNEGFIGIQAPSPIRGDLFLNPEGLELWERNTSNIMLFDTNPLNCVNYARIGVPLDGSRPVPAFGGDIAEANLNSVTNVETEGFDPNADKYLSLYANTLLVNVNPPVLEKEFTKSDGAEVSNRYVGTHSFSINYSDDKQNRFSIKNLHESYKLSNINPGDNTVSSFGGQQATKYNCVSNNPVVNYPIEASMGLMVTNFGYEQCKETDLYKSLNKELISVGQIYGVYSRRYLTREYELKTKKFRDFFNTEVEARIAWDKTIWSRLGFTYEQFGDIDKTVETVKTFAPRPVGDTSPYYPSQERLDKYDFGTRKLKGIITHNSFDFSDIMACANLGSTPVTVNSHNINQYDLTTFSKMKLPAALLLSTPIDTNGGDITTFGVEQKNEFTVISDSQPIDADNLPDLNAGNSYYLITSDIVKPNGLDANGDPMNLIGVMSKENSSNDTLYSVDGIPNIITEERLVSQLSVEIRNPDNSLVPDTIIGKASGFILMIEKAINPNLMAVKSI